MTDLVVVLLLNGLAWGLVIALIALGLSIIFGLLDFINVAHGDFFMVGAVAAWAVVDLTGNFWMAFVLVPLIGFTAGSLIERGIMRPLEHSPTLPFVAAFGLSLILQEGVRATFGSTPKRLVDPIGATVKVLSFEYDVYRLFAAGIAALAIGLFFLFLQRTKMGTWMRAVRQDREIAQALGVPADRIYQLTFGLGTALAMLGGVVAAPITSVDFRLGLDVLPVCFIAVIIGGLGNLAGTAVAAIMLAVMEGVISAVTEPTTARIVSLVLMSAVLVIRPNGIFAKAGR